MAAELAPTTEYEFTLCGMKLQDALQWCLKAAYTHKRERYEQRPVLEGVYFDRDNGAIVATDMFRLHIYHWPELKDLLPASFILQADSAADLLKRLKKELPVARLQFRLEGEHQWARLVCGPFSGVLVEGEFPRWPKVTPDSADRVSCVEGAASPDLIAALKWAAKRPTFQEHNPLFLRVSEKTVSFWNPPGEGALAHYQNGEAKDEGEAITVFANPALIFPALEMFTKTTAAYAPFVLEFWGDLRPFTIRRGEEYTAVIMPCQRPGE